MNLKPRFQIDWLCKAFLLFCGLILFVTMVMKLVTFFFASGAMQGKNDPLIESISTRQMLLLAAVMELLVLIHLFVSRDRLSKVLSILFLSGVFCLYRLSLSAIGFEGDCGCIGGFKSWMVVSNAHMADDLLKGALLLMLGGSLFFMFALKKFAGQPAPIVA